MKKILIVTLMGVIYYWPGRNNDVPLCAKTSWDIIEQLIQQPRILFGTFKERHLYAKGKSTKYGKLSFDSDHALRYSCHLNNIQLHLLGYTVGFSKLWRNK